MLFAFNRMRRLKEQAQLATLHPGETVIPETPTARTLDSYTAQEIIDMNAKEQKAFIEQHELAVDGYKSLKALELEQALLEFLGLVNKDEVVENADADVTVDTENDNVEAPSETSDSE